MNIFFLSYDEPNADKNWRKLQTIAPRAERIHGVAGILEAHRLCAEQATSPMFYVVDGDNEVLDFDFSFTAFANDQDAIHVWRCQNSVNDLVYGYGAIKLFPKSALPSTSFKVDLASSTKKYKIMPEIASITRFNASPWQTWRGAFRECVKLSSKVIHNQKSAESLVRLEAWCTLGADRENGRWSLAGAQAGRAYGHQHRDNLLALAKINDFQWLREQFEALHRE